jgi:ATP-dependent Clp protease ATP-binding subunit ClpA
MYERFTDRARKVMQLANQEAQRFNHEYIGTEHILLGLVQEGSGVAANVFKNLDIDLCKVRLEVEKIIQVGPDMTNMGKLPQTPRAQKVIEYALEEARNLNHNYVGTEHLLLGLLREEEGVAAQILMNLGLELEDMREEVLNLLGPLPHAGEWDPVEEKKRHPIAVPEVPDLPATVKQARAELDAQIALLNEAKESAVAEQDFEQAAHLRDQTDKLRKQKEQLLLGWPARYTIAPSWLSWNGGAILQMAQLIAEEGCWEELPVLGDALQEAGCTDAEILDHCRQPGEHFRRCWVLRLLLGRP